MSTSARAEGTQSATPTPIPDWAVDAAHDILTTPPTTVVAAAQQIVDRWQRDTEKRLAKPIANLGDSELCAQYLSELAFANAELDRVREAVGHLRSSSCPLLTTIAYNRQRTEVLELELAKHRGMPALLLECRDALPAISLTSARLYNVSLTLADRIEAALAPWEVKENPPSL